MKGIRTLGLLACFTLTMTAHGQTKISGVVHCDKPSEQKSVEVGDRQGHSFMVAKGACTWTKPIELDGVETKADAVTQFIEVRGRRGRTQGYVVGTLANGDKTFVRVVGLQTEGSGEGKWTYTGGTGKFSGIKGSGTFKCTGKGDGSSECAIEGEYALAAK
jgi:hypothetical protein